MSNTNLGLLDKYSYKKNIHDLSEELLNRQSLNDFIKSVNTEYFNLFIFNKQKDLYDHFSMDGVFGSYKGSGLSLNIPISVINQAFFDDFMNILKDEPHLFYSGSLKSMIFSITIFNYNDNFYYYIRVMYEFGLFGMVYKPKIKITPFNPILYKENHTLFTLDIIRIVLAIIISIMTFREFISTNELQKKQPKKLDNTVKKILNPFVFLPIIILILYIVAFAKKLSNLNNSILSVFSYNEDHHNPRDYYANSYDYQQIIMIESFIILCLFLRICLSLTEFDRINLFFSYFKDVAIKSYMFIFLLVLLFISFAIFANNIYGYESDNFIDFGSTLISLILIAIGHSPLIPKPNDYNQIWKNLFLTLYILVVVYMFISMFIGVFLEAFRKNLLKEIPSYSERILEKERKKIIEEAKP